MTSIMLRPYQIDGVAAIASETCDLLLERPTGSGKGVELVAGAVKLIGTKRATHVIISTSRVDLEEAFVERAYGAIEYPQKKGSARCSIETPTSMIVPAREISGGSTSAIEDYLDGDNQDGRILVCQSQSFNKVKIPRSTKKMVLMVDEAHHARADGFSRTYDSWKKAGGRVVLATATPYRADGRPVLVDGMSHEAWTMAEHMEAGFCPGKVTTNLLSIGSAPVDIKHLRGEVAPEAEVLIEMWQKMVEHWISNPPGRRHKLAVRIPPMLGGSGWAVEAGIEAFQKAGARVFNATGLGKGKAAELSALMSRERAATYSESELDVLIGIQRVTEGLDWVHCSAVANYGIPGSKGLAVQLLGRSMRMKAKDHPFREESVFSCYVESAGGKTLDLLKKSHSRETLLMCCVMSDIGTRQSLAIIKAVNRGVSKGKPSERGKRKAVALAALEAGSPRAPEAQLLLSQALSKGRKSVGRAMTEMTLAARFKEAEAARAVLNHLSMQPGMGKRVTEVVEKKMKAGADILKAIEEAVEEFRDETLEATEDSSKLVEQAHVLTGESIRKAASRLASFSLPPEILKTSPLDVVKMWESVC